MGRVKLTDLFLLIRHKNSINTDSPFLIRSFKKISHLFRWELVRIEKSLLVNQLILSL